MANKYYNLETLNNYVFSNIDEYTSSSQTSENKTISRSLYDDDELDTATNVYDPKVVFDPNPDITSTIAKQYIDVREPIEDTQTTTISGESTGELSGPTNGKSSKNSKTPQGQLGNEQISSVKVDGIFAPLLEINNQVIDSMYIDSFVFEYDEMLPKLTLTLSDNYTGLHAENYTRQNNIVKFGLVPAAPNIYKTVKMDFEIEAVDGQTIICKYKLPVFVTDKQNAKYLSHESKTKFLNTWDMCYEIAKETGLGFSATPGIKDYSDNSIRIIFNKSYYEYIQEEVSSGGTSEEQILDVWIDLNGYLTLVDINRLFSLVKTKEIAQNNISVIALGGNMTTSKDLPSVQAYKVKRVLTNFDQTGIDSNMKITRNIQKNANYAKSIFNGTEQRIYSHVTTGSAYGQGDPVITSSGEKVNIGGLVPLDIHTEENSNDGSIFEDYAKQGPIKCIFFNPELSSYNKEIQRYIRDKYLQTKEQNQYTVYLDHANYGLQRGTIIGITWFEYDNAKKKRILESVGNLSGNASLDSSATKFNKNVPKELKAENLQQNPVGVIDYSVSDLYYIHGMKFTYTKQGGVQQILYCIKCGPMNNYLNKYTVPKFSASKYTGGAVSDNEAKQTSNNASQTKNNTGSQNTTEQPVATPWDKPITNILTSTGDIKLNSSRDSGD